MEVFIENLIKRRKSLFPRQDDFAELVNLSLRGYQKYEQGESAPTPDILDRFSLVLKCRPWQLVMDEREYADLVLSLEETVYLQAGQLERIIGEKRLLMDELSRMKASSTQIASPMTPYVTKKP